MSRTCVRTMPRLTILRGLPGSGKSRHVEREIDDLKAVVCSADHFFLDKEGHYDFKPYLIAQAHEACKLKALRSMSSGKRHVIIDNTNTQEWEYKFYLVMAMIFGYSTDIIMIGTTNPEDVKLYAERNMHGVPLETIQTMAERWES